MKYHGFGAALLATLSLTGPAKPQETAPEAPAASLSTDTVPAVGRKDVILTISQFGRYAITVASQQGTALQLVDRMAGPGPVMGRAGSVDGRIDMFLDRGEYKIITWAHELGSGEARLSVHPFAERDPTRAPLLVELKPIDETLDDFEQASYWIDVSERRPVILEGAGRNLTDLRFWKDGSWLVDASPAVEVVEPKSGQPFTVCRLAAQLEPGLYRLTAYGGPPQPWADESGGHPFHLRFGIPKLGEAGRRRHRVGPFGVDRFLVPGRATYFRLELPEARPASLNVSWFDVQNPFSLGGATETVQKESVPPLVEIGTEGDESRLHILTVTAEAGQPYILQHFEQSWVYPFQRTGDYWLSTIHSGHPADSVDATALLVDDRGQRDHWTPTEYQVVEVGQSSGWARRANLLGELTVFLRVVDGARYEIVSRGTEARFRIEPFLLSPPPQYAPPEFQGSGSVWELEPGFYVLTVEPVQKGILDVAIRPAGFFDSILEWAGLGREQGAEPVRAAVRFPRLHLLSDHGYTLHLSHQPEVKAGVILRRLPLDLTEPLPLTQRPEETVTVDFQANEAGTLIAEAEDGSSLDVSLDGTTWQRQWKVEPGHGSVSVRHRGEEIVVASLRLAPDRLAPDTPLPQIESPPLAQVLPVLTEEAPQYLDLERNAKATYLVRADEPALYRLETTGLLATEGNLRTRTIPSFLRAAGNGVGRNFLIQQYLREGDYEITVSPQGLSRGHLGLKLERTELVDGGELAEGIPARISLPAGRAIAYGFTIENSGKYRLRAVGLNRSFLGRLEDDAGWPIVEPNRAADITEDFDPGRYRLLLMPDAVETRRLTLLSRIPEPARMEGHGPHPLPLETVVEHQWLEPEDGEERSPDVWEIDLPAAVEATLRLTNEMQGTLKRDGEEVAYVPPERGWTGNLGEGRYRLEVTCVRRNNRVDYEVSFTPSELVAGLARPITAPVVVPFAVGPDELVELSSFGSTDVQASLLDEAGRFIAWNDDRPADWNFQILHRLAPGKYQIRVDPVGRSAGVTEVSMRAPREIEQSVLALPARIEPGLRDGILLYPLELPAERELLIVDARSSESMGVTIEASTGMSGTDWNAIASAVGPSARLAVPLEDAGKYRLRLWSQDRRGSPVRLAMATVTPTRFSESQAEDTITLEPVPGIAQSVKVAAVALERPGLFRLEGDGTLFWSSTAHQPFEESPNGLAAPHGSILWLMGESREARASRVVLAPGTGAGVALRVPYEALVSCDLEAGAKGPLLATVRSMAGQPGIRVSESTEGGASGKTMAVGTRSAVSPLLAPRRPSVTLWAAERTVEPLDLRLSYWSFAPAERGSSSWGFTQGSLKGLAAHSFELPEGAKQIRLALGESTVGVLSNGDAIRSVHWTGGGVFEETIHSSAATLTLLHTGEDEDRFSVEVLPLEEAPVLRPGTPFEHWFSRAGRIRIPLAAEDGPERLHIRGAEEAVLVESNGNVERGTDLTLRSSGGELLVRHTPGLVLSWIEREGASWSGAWSSSLASTSPKPVEIEPPAKVPIEGESKVFRFTLAHPVMLHLRTEAPIATQLSIPGDETPEIKVHPGGGVLDAYLPGGAAELAIRGLGGARLWGNAEITTTPIESIGEGLGPEVLLLAGATRLFSFTVERNGPVGIGVRASSDNVESVLMDSSGRRLGSGVVQMLDLEPGTYLLALHAQNTATAVRARPALAGIEPPDTGPPDEVVRRYLEMAGVMASPQTSERPEVERR